MKKNISINISGIIFHIEEDGYDVLRKYLDSINGYFGSYEDSSEIISDIETRIAEIFLGKLNEDKQVITAEDVQSVMATMGSINDFKAAEQEASGEEARQEANPSQPYRRATTNQKKLYRDKRKKILGGVAAGLAHYFNIDPIWPRVLLSLMIFATYGSLVVLYIILWIVLPASDELEEEGSVKKMFRSSDNKVLGGVAGGVAAFFGVDTVLMRVIFVALTIFGGLGILLYCILWIALPEARTITEKMQMQGEPVTLSNIETSVKKSLNEKDGQDESTLAKIILFPFRLLATIITAIAKLIGPLFQVIVDVVRILAGLVISLLGLSLLISVIIFAFTFFGLISLDTFPTWWGDEHLKLGLPLEAFRNSFSSWAVGFALLVFFIPGLFITMIGNSIIAKRFTFHALVGWSLFALFFISVVVTCILVPQMIYAFKEDGEYKTERQFDLHGKVPTLMIKEVGLDDYQVSSLEIEGYEGKVLTLTQHFEAQGSSRKSAAENAQTVTYNVLQQDSLLIFDSNLTFKKDAKFHAQRIKMKLMVPYDQTIFINREMWRLLKNRGAHQYYFYDYENDHSWKVTRDGLTCITCQEPTEEKKILNKDQFGLKDFTNIEVSGLVDLVIENKDTYSVRIEGNADQKKRYKVYQTAETLFILFDGDDESFWKNTLLKNQKVQITITLPHLEKLKVKGLGNLTLRDFDEHEIDLELQGLIDGEADFKSENLTLELRDNAKLDLHGHGNFMEVTVNDASHLKAYDFEVEHAIVNANGLSSAKVNATQALEIHKGKLSTVMHRGEPANLKED